VAERWVSPPLVPREPPPAWVAVWRFRLAALLLLGLLVLATFLLYRQLSGANAQDPGIGALPAALTASSYG
jgi:cytochrome bd-type quinol oxidase subunit 1